jgi:hypothetical protein
MIITYSECVSVVLSIQHANAHARYLIIMCGLSGCTIFSSLSHVDADTDGRTNIHVHDGANSRFSQI